MFDYKQFVALSRKIYGTDDIQLHSPVFTGNEKKYLIDCIDSNFVSSVGAKVTKFEKKIAEFVGTKYAVAVINGTAALHISIQIAGVKQGDEVISQAVNFIATCNAISYVGANPLFVDVDLDTMGMSPKALLNFLEKNVIKRNGFAYNKTSGRRIAACIPMHTFGLPCRIAEIVEICAQWGINVIEDAAESLGSFVGKSHTGTFGKMGVLSFNGNKIITTGGGGMLVTNDETLAKKAKHITTTAKLKHSFEYFHDEIGFNYRLPNLNAALGCAQMEQLKQFLLIKSKIAKKWSKFFEGYNVSFAKALDGNTTNHWLNAIILNSKKERDEFLDYTNLNGVKTRPIWALMPKLPMFKHCQSDGLKNSIWLENRVVNIPSSVPLSAIKKEDDL